MQVLFFGDLVGRVAVNAVLDFVSRDKAEIKIANAENASDGFGLSYETYHSLIKGGFDMLTGGNHIWDKKDVLGYINKAHLARPCNLPQGAPGKDWQIISRAGIKIAIINVLGRAFMPSSALDCPFRACDRVIEEIHAKEGKVEIILVDVHAESTSEKMAIAHYLDGRVSAVLGTHTHVPTADERIFPKGTAYISDIGACAAWDSIIGMSTEGVLRRFLTGMPEKLKASTKAPAINAVRITFDPDDHRVQNIERVSRRPESL